jgi:hypothetical protein
MEHSQTAVNTTTQTEEATKELTLTNWQELTQEQQETLKETLIKSKYGIGGEHFSTFPTLLDNKINTWVEEKYQISKLPKRVQEQTFKTWEGNGSLKIIPLNKGTKTHYLITIKPNKNIKMDLWKLEKEDTKPYLKYTTAEQLTEVTLTKNHFHILNSYTNKNKAYNQAKALVKLFQLGTDFQTLELQKELKTNYLQLELNGEGKWELQEIGKNNHKPTGKTWEGLEAYTGRKQHKSITINYLENIN